MSEAQLVSCEGCGRRARLEPGITAGDDTWWHLSPPFEVGYAASGFGDGHCCSLACVRAALAKLEPAYAALEDRLVGNPLHVEEGRTA